MLSSYSYLPITRIVTRNIRKRMSDHCQVFFPFAVNYYSLLFESVVVLAVVEMWETLRRFPRTVGSDLCFPSVRHFHGCLELLTILLSPFWPVRLDSSGY